MIRYDLICEQRHTFDGWFRDSAAFDQQAKKGLVSCPRCGSVKVEKAIMAPRVSGASRRGKTEPEPTVSEAASPVAMMAPEEKELRTKLRELREHLTKNSDNVGKRFPEEARKMHYGEIEHRSIYGEASPKDAKALHEEGIAFHSLPMLPEDKN
ncbi:MAG TPA: DUF1178 family protein [Xanthobacteraceae bacterium]|jgi:hypothetical protein|nr:DUF1178 family protein [Xanthobacteraceae bacterium]